MDKQLFTDFVEVLTKHKITIGIERTDAPVDGEIPLDNREHQQVRDPDVFVSKDTHEKIIAEKDEHIYTLLENKKHILNLLAEHQKVLAEIVHAIGMDRDTALKDFPRIMFASLGYGYDDFDNEGHLLINEEDKQKAEQYQITVNPDGIFDRSAIKTNLGNLILWVGNIRKKVNWTDAHTDEVVKRLQDIMEKVL